MKTFSKNLKNLQKFSNYAFFLEILKDNLKVPKSFQKLPRLSKTSNISKNFFNIIKKIQHYLKVL